MYVKGIQPCDVHQIVERVSRKYFGGNLTFTRTPEYYCGRGIRFTLRVRDSRGPGHRKGLDHGWRNGAKPRRMVAACYHAYGEVIRALLAAGAEWVQTAPITLERYRSGGAKPKRWTRETWREHAHEMAYVNIGSQMYPAYFADACDCEVGPMPEMAQKYAASTDWSGLKVNGTKSWPVSG